jgi:hypothetical protein
MNCHIVEISLGGPLQIFWIFFSESETKDHRFRGGLKLNIDCSGENHKKYKNVP